MRDHYMFLLLNKKRTNISELSLISQIIGSPQIFYIAFSNIHICVSSKARTADRDCFDHNSYSHFCFIYKAFLNSLHLIVMLREMP